MHIDVSITRLLTGVCEITYYRRNFFNFKYSINFSHCFNLKLQPDHTATAQCLAKLLSMKHILITTFRNAAALSVKCERFSNSHSRKNKTVI